MSETTTPKERPVYVVLENNTNIGEPAIGGVFSTLEAAKHHADISCFLDLDEYVGAWEGNMDDDGFITRLFNTEDREDGFVLIQQETLR